MGEWVEMRHSFSSTFGGEDVEMTVGWISRHLDLDSEVWDAGRFTDVIAGCRAVN